MTTDKEIEKQRYNSRAQFSLSGKFHDKEKMGSINVALPLQAPYRHFERLILDNYPSSEASILEIGSGTGAFTGILISSGASVVATDISDLSLKVLVKNLESPLNLRTKVVDMEELTFKDASFDLITSAGALSYGDNELVMNEIFRVLKKGGKVIFVDSLNHNIIYKFNRYINYLKGKRSKSTLKWMPDLILIEKYFKKFGYGKVKFFGSITWCFPILKLFLTSKIIYQFSNWLDKKLKIKKSAFKFVLVLKKKN